jgi:hypothetical protein
VGELGSIFTSNIPLPGGLFLGNLLDKTCEAYKEVFCTLDQSKQDLGRILESRYANLHIHYGSHGSSIAETILNFLEEHHSSFTTLDIVYGDTFSTSLFSEAEEKDIVFIADSDGSDEWDHVNRDKSGKLTFFDQTEEMRDFCMTGGFRIINPSLFLISLVDSVRNNIHLKGAARNSRDFHVALEIYDAEQTTPFLLKKDPSWKDLGHRRTYFRQRREYISNGARVFNSLDFDLKAGWVTKRGVSEKIRQEIEWFVSVPNSLRHYVPDVKKLKDKSSYAIQYIPSIPLNEHWISENPNRDFWIDLLVSLEDMLGNFSCVTENLTLEEVVVSKRSVYVEKVTERGLALSNIANGSSSDDLCGLDSDYLDALISKIAGSVLCAGEVASNLPSWSFIHGDLCFSNIIYDQISDNPKLIDPRGSFGKSGIFGDPTYELLKLSQCILSDYDYLAANLYSLNIKNGEMLLDLPQTKEHVWFKALFREFLEKELTSLGIDYNTFRALEAGLFLSAAPLHSENSRWLALVLKARDVLRELD